VLENFSRLPFRLVRWDLWTLRAGQHFRSGRGLVWVDVGANFLVELFALLRQKTSGFPTAIGARSVQFVSRGTFRPLSARGLYPMGPGSVFSI
jgi:hypothetical protein